MQSVLQKNNTATPELKSMLPSESSATKIMLLLLLLFAPCMRMIAPNIDEITAAVTLTNDNHLPDPSNSPSCQICPGRSHFSATFTRNPSSMSWSSCILLWLTICRYAFFSTRSHWLLTPTKEQA